MQNKHEAILRAINNTSGKYNILTFPTHEAFQSNWATMPHTFYLYQGEGIKPWNNKYRQLPPNHVLLDGGPSQIKVDIKFDMVLSQNKFGQFQVAKQAAEYIGIPLISIEHTLPPPVWNKKQKQQMADLSGDINVFISEYSVKEWGFDPNDPAVKVIHHGLDTNVFAPRESPKLINAVLTVVNDWKNRDWCCGWSIFSRITGEGTILPVMPLGDTPGFSQAAQDRDDLIRHYQDCAVFLNTSTVSPVPTGLLEAMSCGCPGNIWQIEQNKKNMPTKSYWKQVKEFLTPNFHTLTGKCCRMTKFGCHLLAVISISHTSGGY
jgi:glycosyltransferase involved in cell wall biosynthesis